MKKRLLLTLIFALLVSFTGLFACNNAKIKSNTAHSHISLNVNEVCSTCKLKCTYKNENCLVMENDDLIRGEFYGRVVQSTSLPYAYGEDMTEVYFADSVKRIEDNALKNFKKVKSVIMSDSITSIGYSAFYDTDKLKTNEYDNACYLGNETNKYLVLVKAKSTSITSVKIHDKTRVILENAFSDCTALKTVEKSDGIKDIGRNAFLNCRALTSYDLPNDLTLIDAYSFKNCSSLRTINVGDNIEEIEIGAFMGCTSLESVTFGNSLRKLSGDVFYGCVKLTSVDLPDSLELMSFDFVNCNRLTTIRFGEKLTMVTGHYFKGCNQLANVYVSEKNQNIKSVDNIVYSKDGTVLELYPAGKTAKTFNIPESVTKIGEYAFTGCNHLEKVSLGEDVTRIGSDAFSNCLNLKKVVFNEGLVNPGDYTFAGCDSLEYVIAEKNIFQFGSNFFVTNSTSLPKVKLFYKGSVNDWDSLTGRSFSYKNMERCNVYYYSVTTPTDTTYRYWRYVNGEPTAW